MSILFVGVGLVGMGVILVGAGEVVDEGTDLMSCGGGETVVGVVMIPE